MLTTILAITTLFLGLLILLELIRLFIPSDTKKRKALPQSLMGLELRGGKHHHPVKIFENFILLSLWWLTLPLFSLFFINNNNKIENYLGFGLFLALLIGSWWWWRQGSFKTAYSTSNNHDEKRL